MEFLVNTSVILGIHQFHSPLVSLQKEADLFFTCALNTSVTYLELYRELMSFFLSHHANMSV